MWIWFRPITVCSYHGVHDGWPRGRLRHTTTHNYQIRSKWSGEALSDITLCLKTNSPDHSQSYRLLELRGPSTGFWFLVCWLVTVVTHSRSGVMLTIHVLALSLALHLWTSSGFSFTIDNTPQQCSDLNISVIGSGQPPYSAIWFNSAT